MTEEEKYLDTLKFAIRAVSEAEFEAEQSTDREQIAYAHYILTELLAEYDEV